MDKKQSKIDFIEKKIIKEYPKYTPIKSIIVIGNYTDTVWTLASKTDGSYKIFESSVRLWGNTFKFRVDYYYKTEYGYTPPEELINSVPREKLNIEKF